MGLQLYSQGSLNELCQVSHLKEQRSIHWKKSYDSLLTILAAWECRFVLHSKSPTYHASPLTTTETPKRTNNTQKFKQTCNSCTYITKKYPLSKTTPATKQHTILSFIFEKKTPIANPKWPVNHQHPTRCLRRPRRWTKEAKPSLLCFLYLGWTIRWWL